MITAHLATLYERRDTLQATVLSLASQADRVFIALNLYPEIPEWLRNIHNVKCVITDNSCGDAHKFQFLPEVEGVALCCDDDLIYNNGYAGLMLRGLQRHGGVVTLHGKIYNRPFVAFRRWARSYHCMHNQPMDVRIDVPGSGVSAFDTKIGFNMSFCTHPNMGDVFLGAFCASMGISVTLLAHDKSILTYNPPQGKTIWETTRNYALHDEVLKKVLK